MEDVIIIGGGPVGFINALGLAQAGVRVTVIEAEPKIIDSPRAAVYFWSVLDGLERLGILEEAEAAGVRKQDYTYLVRRTGERIVYSMEILKGHTPYPYNLHLGQHLLAEIAMRRLKAFSNATVRFGTRLQMLHQGSLARTAPGARYVDCSVFRSTERRGRSGLWPPTSITISSATATRAQRS
jgi:2-polyprenyl-6-methoxyphenol hydroxylase-like FAD-dependent oxidoreductase